MTQNKKILALDIGERRIGVAIASSIARIASPLETIDTQKQPDTMEYIAKLVDDNDITTLIVGLPRGLDGQETIQTKYVREFTKQLTSKVSTPIIMQDEAGTSVEAEQRLKLHKKSYTKEDIDSMAATIILSDYMQETFVS